jgi:hypothetical protein
MMKKSNGIIPALLAAAQRRIPWHITRGAEGAEQVSRVVAECACSAKPMVAGITGC